MKLQKILSNFQKLHPKEIDLSLDRIKNLCNKLGNPQDKIKAISIVGTNGKNSTIQAMYAILKEANFNCNVYTSPHIQKINERFVFNNQQLNDDELANLLEEVEKVNNNEPITVFEMLSACFFYKAAEFPNNINLLESGLFHRFDAVNILKTNLASIVTAISKDHLDWLPKNKQTIEQIVFEKTSALLNSNIIVAKQNRKETMACIKKTIVKNLSNKLFFNEDFSFTNDENGNWYYEDKFGGLKLPLPNVLGQFQLENISTAIATLRSLNIGIKDDHIKKGINKIESIARLQEIKSGKNMLVDFKDEDFESKVKQEEVSVIQFSAAWCGPCKALKPVMDKLSDEYKDKASFYYGDIEDGAINTGSAAGIRGVPTVIIYKKGVEVSRKVGGVPESHMKQFLDENI